MKKLSITFTGVIAIIVLISQCSIAQVMLKKAVISNGGGFATNGSTNGLFIAGQSATGTASNSQTIGHFGFFAAPGAVSMVKSEAAGSISSVIVSPNPASEDSRITITLANSGDLDLFLYDASGHFIRTIYSGKREAGLLNFRLDAKSLSSGAYFIAARMPGALVQTKFNVVK